MKNNINLRNRKILYWLLAILGIVIIGIVLYFSIGNPQRIFPSSDVYNVQIINQNPITFKVTVSPANVASTTGGSNGYGFSCSHILTSWNVRLGGNAFSGVGEVANVLNPLFSAMGNYTNPSKYNYNVTGGYIDYFGNHDSITQGTCTYTGMYNSQHNVNTTFMDCLGNLAYAIPVCASTYAEFTVVATPINIPSNTVNETIQNQSVIVNNPPQTIQPSGWNLFWLNAGKFISDFWAAVKSVILPQTIYGPQAVTPGQTVSYSINMTAPNYADNNSQDGTFSEQFGSWKLLDENNNTIAQANPLYTKIDKNYNTIATIQIPSSGTSGLVAIIDEIDYTYNYSTATWSHTENIVKEEGYNINSNINGPVVVSPNGWDLFWNNIKSFLHKIFPGIF